MPLFEIERVSRFLLTLDLPRLREFPPAQAAELMEWAWEEDDRQSGAEGTIRVLAIVTSFVGVLVCAIAFTFDFPSVVRFAIAPGCTATAIATALWLRARRQVRFKHLLSQRTARHKLGADRCPECGTPVARDVRITLPPEVPDRVPSTGG